MEEKNQKEKIAAVVVTYNRKGLLKECLDALLNQTRPLDSIILIDNASTDDTPEFLKEKGYLDNPKLDYVRLPENTGGSGGFHEGVKRGYEKGYDWLWLMDDDVKPIVNCLEIFLERIEEIYNKENIKPTVVVGCKYDFEGKFLNQEAKKLNISNPFKNLYHNIISKKDLLRNYFLIEGFSFEGPLISRNIIQKIGFPDKRFFIWADDTDFCLRIKKTGGKIYYIPNAKVIRMNKLIATPLFKSGRAHFLIRNLTYIDLKYGNLFVKIFRPIIRNGRILLGRIYRRDFKNCKLIISSFYKGKRMYLEEYNYFI